MTSPSPDADSKRRPPRANLLLPWEIVVAPARAFDRIAVAPEWMVAYGLIIVIMAISAFAEFPAYAHVYAVMNPASHGLKPNSGQVFANFVIEECATPLLGILLTTAALTIFAGIRDFKKMVAYPAILSLVTNCTLIDVFGELLRAIALRFHAVSSFTDFRSLDAVFPVNLTLLATPGNPSQAEFLSHFGLFSLWADIVLAFGFAKLTKIRLVPSLVFILSLELATALVFYPNHCCHIREVHS